MPKREGGGQGEWGWLQAAIAAVGEARRGFADTLTTLLEEPPNRVSERGDQGMTLVHAVVEQDLAAGGLRMGRRHER